MKALAYLFGLTALAGTAYAGGMSGSGLVVLNRTASSSLSLNGNSSIQVPARAVYVNSSNNNSVRMVGNAILDCPYLYVCGGTNMTGGAVCTGQVCHAATPYDDPCSGVAIPTATTGMTAIAAMSITTAVTLNPGYYSGGVSITGNADVTLNPGTYFIKNGFKLTSGSLHGSGVTFVMLSGGFELGGNGDINLSASTEGALLGMTVAQPSSNTSQLKLAGGSNLNVFGTVYAPKANATLTGNSSMVGVGPQVGDMLVADTVTVQGTGAVKIGKIDMKAVELPKQPLAD